MVCLEVRLARNLAHASYGLQGRLQYKGMHRGLYRCMLSSPLITEIKCLYALRFNSLWYVVRRMEYQRFVGCLVSTLRPID